MTDINLDIRCHDGSLPNPDCLRRWQATYHADVSKADKDLAKAMKTVRKAYDLAVVVCDGDDECLQEAQRVAGISSLRAEKNHSTALDLAYERFRGAVNNNCCD